MNSFCVVLLSSVLAAAGDEVGYPPEISIGKDIVVFIITSDNSEFCNAALITKDKAVTALNCFEDDSVKSALANSVLYARVGYNIFPNRPWTKIDHVLENSQNYPLNYYQLTVAILESSIGIDRVYLAGWPQSSNIYPEVNPEMQIYTFGRSLNCIASAIAYFADCGDKSKLTYELKITESGAINFLPNSRPGMVITIWTGSPVFYNNHIVSICLGIERDSDNAFCVNIYPFLQFLKKKGIITQEAATSTSN